MSVTANPPRWAEGLLRAFLKADDFESVSGDLLEQTPNGLTRPFVVLALRGRRHADQVQSAKDLSQKLDHAFPPQF